MAYIACYKASNVLSISYLYIQKAYFMVHYDWHSAKCDSNIDKHGLDFIDAPLVYESLEKVTFKAIREDEERYIDIAPVGERLMVLVYTIRNSVVWVISYRKAKIPKEEFMYNKARKEVT